MGIKNFSKTFKSVRTVKFKDLRGQTLAIDAMTELYRAALGAKTISTLTDANGNPTMHINVILSIIIDLHRNGVNQIWVFDYNQDPTVDFHNPMKIAELAKRKKRKDLAIEQIKSLADVKDNNPLFSDSEDEQNLEETSKADSGLDLSIETKNTLPIMRPVILTLDEEKHVETLSYRQKAQFMLKKTNEAKKIYEQELSDYNFQKNKKAKIASLEKQTFSVSKEMINDVKFVLTCLGIKFIEAPKGFEGEAIASYLTQIEQADAVFSGDTDPIAYGAKCLLRRNPRDKLIYEYTQEDVLRQIAEANEEFSNPTLLDLHVVAMALGTDACEKTPGIGPATVLKKLHTIELTPKQISAMKEFTKIPDLSEITTYNADLKAFVQCQSDTLIEWLVTEKSFNRTRIKTQLDKVLLGAEAGSKAGLKAESKASANTSPPKKTLKNPILRKISKK